MGYCASCGELQFTNRCNKCGGRVAVSSAFGRNEDSHDRWSEKYLNRGLERSGSKRIFNNSQRIRTGSPSVDRQGALSPTLETAPKPLPPRPGSAGAGSRNTTPSPNPDSSLETTSTEPDATETSAQDKRRSFNTTFLSRHTPSPTPGSRPPSVIFNFSKKAPSDLSRSKTLMSATYKDGANIRRSQTSAASTEPNIEKLRSDKRSSYNPPSSPGLNRNATIASRPASAIYGSSSKGSSLSVKPPYIPSTPKAFSQTAEPNSDVADIPVPAPVSEITKSEPPAEELKAEPDAEAAPSKTGLPIAEVPASKPQSSTSTQPQVDTLKSELKYQTGASGVPESNDVERRKPLPQPPAKGPGKGRICFKCNNLLGTSWYTLPDGRSIHPDCCVCEGCSKPFEDGIYISVNGKLYHEACIPRKASTKSTSEYSCKRCEQDIHGSWITLSDGSKYHPHCFRCEGCDLVIDDGVFISRNGKPYHEQCVQRPKCVSCGLDIRGGYITYREQRYHTQCFKCTGCQKVIGETPFGQIKSEPYCEPCLTDFMSRRTKELNLRTQNLNL
ncbi:hypothetical protein K493DRAFT_407539 [Basidiobolus meristosporus CBS 931.73]|uniref:LIM zinc-binding domain-containing protein n=1 Tax=Basidiobolus meristosporus CBS 931.73 TaxID=1314790 RepID=A0A1Y1YC79_9FUNG|nr:hypothetical protein K493DRAFT_407539 [Basidiobolus meristosporus CBS 931.73]|eukprot:ORX95640.1 hypothetical protein K493DRAFT_407539 [Basidiobolus meristosporus CBS 931.73]